MLLESTVSTETSFHSEDMLYILNSLHYALYEQS